MLKWKWISLSLLCPNDRRLAWARLEMRAMMGMNANAETMHEVSSRTWRYVERDALEGVLEGVLFPLICIYLRPLCPCPRSYLIK